MTKEWSRDLEGLVVVVTRARLQARALCRALEARGAKVILFPVVAMRTRLEARLERVWGMDTGWLFTSPNGIRCLADWWDRALPWLPWKEALAQTWVGCVGQATSEALRVWGKEADCVADGSGALGLLCALDAVWEWERPRFFFPCSSRARSTLVEGLRERGAEVDVFPIYDTISVVPEGTEFWRFLREEKIAFVTLTSPSIVESFCDAVGVEVWSDPSKTWVWACIGETTGRSLQKMGETPHIVATSSTVEGLCDAMARYMEERTSPKPRNEEWKGTTS